MTLPIVYLGPSLPLESAQSILKADYRPPVSRGDILAAIEDKPVKAIGIVDGRFLQHFAISPKEILVALERGIRVYGSSSMGALRAVELEPYGMVGVGRVFEMYRDGTVDADDEVAIVFDPVSLRPLSVPLVNIRLALADATVGGCIDDICARVVLDYAKAMHYADRTYEAAIEAATQQSPDLSTQLESLRAFVQSGRSDAKGDDAKALLRRMAAVATG